MDSRGLGTREKCLHCEIRGRLEEFLYIEEHYSLLGNQLLKMVSLPIQLFRFRYGALVSFQKMV